tara:strand:+ start:133 stop:552 length:420 start_codon:yes stop_codon:yes gene_type:complete
MNAKNQFNKNLAAIKREEKIPKIVICPNYKSLDLVKTEFISLLGIKSTGLCLITLNEAIEHKLPIRKAQEDYNNKIPHDVYLANTVDELIPLDYLDQEEIIDLDSIVKYFLDNPRKQERNKLCLCESGLKYKNCCININ